MLIGVDASRAVAERPTGTQTYSRRLAEQLPALCSGHRLRYYFRQQPPQGAFAGAEVCVIPFPRLWTHIRLSFEMQWRPPDALWVPAHVLPLLHPQRSVVTVHDLGYLHFPRAHPAGQRLYLDLSTRWSARAARRLVADSEATKADLVSHYAVAPAKVTVAYPGVDPAPVCSRAEMAALGERLGVRGDYFLFVGTLQPRKNLPRLLAAYAALGAHAPKLVLAGAPGWGERELLRDIERLGLGERVRLPGYIEDADKAALLSGARAMVFPSLYEGFGLPVLEAQACGCPVICSNTSSLPEVAGGAALLVDPLDVDALCGAMQQLLEDAALRAELAARGLANARRFTWRACAERVLNAIEDSAV